VIPAGNLFRKALSKVNTITTQRASVKTTQSNATEKQASEIEMRQTRQSRYSLMWTHM
jgi:hypothetical protein